MRAKQGSRATLIKLAIVVFVVSMVAAACSDSEGDTTTTAGTAPVTTSAPEPGETTTAGPATTSAPTEAPPPAPGAEVLRIHLEADISNVDPAINPGTTNTRVAINIFENLVAYDPRGKELVNELAETFEVSEDGLSYDFKLKEGIQFHRGYGEVTAEDVKFSFERIAGLTDPPIESSYQRDWGALKEVIVHDRYSGTIVLNEPTIVLLTTTIPYGSGRIVSKAAVEDLGDEFGTNPVGTGPYEWVNWTRNESVTLQKFADYGGARDGIADAVFDTLEFVIIDDANPTLIALETGELDFASLGPETVDRAETLSGLTVDERTSLRYNWLGMNLDHPNFQNEDVRRAVIAGVDIDTILAAAFEGRWTRATGIIAPGMPLGFWEGAPVHQRDVALATSLLEGADAVGLQIEMQVNAGHDGAADLAQIIQQQLNEVGFKVSIGIQDGGVFNDRSPEALAQKQLFYQSFGTRPDPGWSTVWFTCDQVGNWNFMMWCDEDYDALHDAALVETDLDARHDMYVQMQQLMEDSTSVLWVAWPASFYASLEHIDPAIREDGEVIPWAFRLKG